MIRTRALTGALFVVACSGWACSDSGGSMDAGVPDTPEWTTAFDAENVGWFLSAWGPAPDDVYAVGGAPDDGLLMHFDGTTWSEVDTGLSFPLINWAYGFGGDNITFVGSRGTVLHYDGTRFTEQGTPTDQDLWGVWGAAPNDMWAVGGNGAELQPTILHYDGTAWTKSATPTLSRPSVSAYFKVWGTSSNNVYVVGQKGALAHWDGTAWTEVESGTSEDLVSLWGTGPDRIAIVGGRANGHIVTYDGASWRHQSLAPLPGLNGVWMRNNDKVHIAGGTGALATVDFDTLEVTTEASNSFLTVHAVFSAGGPLYAVGGSLLSIDPPHKGLALERALLDSE